MTTSYLREFFNNQQAWVPPEYPELSSYEWDELFDAGTEQQKINLANHWCWRFNAENYLKEEAVKLACLSKNYRFSSKIHAYVQHELFPERSPYTVLTEYAEKHIKAQDRQRFVLAIEDVCLLEPKQALSALAGLVEFIYSYKSTTFPLHARELVFMQNIAWEALTHKEFAQHSHIALAIQVTMKAAIKYVNMSDVHPDPRAKAWHALTHAVVNAYGGIDYLNVEGINVLDVIREMPAAITFPGLNTLIFKGSVKTVDGNRVFNRKSALGPNPSEIPNVFDVLRHWIPSYTKLWDTAQALGMPVTEAAKQVYADYQNHSGVSIELPSDLSATL